MQSCPMEMLFHLCIAFVKFTNLLNLDKKRKVPKRDPYVELMIAKQEGYHTCYVSY